MLNEPSALSISFAIADESRDIVKLLAIGYRSNGSIFTLDTGLTVAEAKELCAVFVTWMDQCIGREIERAREN